MSENHKPIRLDEVTLETIRAEAREIARKQMERRARSTARQQEREKNVIQPENRKPDTFERVAGEQIQFESEEEELYHRAFNKLLRQWIKAHPDYRPTKRK